MFVGKGDILVENVVDNTECKRRWEVNGQHIAVRTSDGITEAAARNSAQNHVFQVKIVIKESCKAGRQRKVPEGLDDQAVYVVLALQTASEAFKRVANSGATIGQINTWMGRDLLRSNAQ